MRKHLVWIALSATFALAIGVLFMTPMLDAAEVLHFTPQTRDTADGLATPMDNPIIGQSQPPNGDVTIKPPEIVLDNHQASGVLGREIRSAADENMGRIIDVIVDRAGLTRAAVIDFGGFLGVGSRKIAVDWNALHFATNDKQSRITLEMTKDQVKAAPEYQDGKPITILGALGNSMEPRLSSAIPER